MTEPIWVALIAASAAGVGYFSQMAIAAIKSQRPYNGQERRTGNSCSIDLGQAILEYQRNCPIKETMESVERRLGKIEWILMERRKGQ